MNATSVPRYGPPPHARDLADPFDVCVVGSGASGATVAWLCARYGLRVAVVEQGGFVGPDVGYDDLLAEAEPAWVRQDNGTWAQNGYPWTTCNVGGGTVFFGGAFFRYRPLDFDPERALGRAEVPLRWPLPAHELDVFYDAIEDLVGVAGVADADPSLPPRGSPYPLPPVASSPEGVALMAGARTLGWRPFPTPLALNSRARGGRGACEADAPCISRRCPVGAKGDALDRLLEPAIAAGATLFAGMKAARLIASSRRQIGELECIRVDTGETYRVRAAHFVVCANAVQTAALLLRSDSPLHAGALGNANDMVGRGLCFKLSEYAMGYRHGAAASAPAVAPGLGPFSTCAVADLYDDRQAPGGIGGLLYEARPERPYAMRDDEQMIRIEALVADQPQLQNRVRLKRATSRFGLPDVVMDYQAHPRDLARLEYMLAHGESLLRAAGCGIVIREPSGWSLGSCHLHGTCRMGADARSSVTDETGRVHELENLYVGDGALFPFPGGANPTLTIQAMALRTAHLILAEKFGIHASIRSLGAVPAAGSGRAAQETDARPLAEVTHGSGAAWAASELQAEPR